MTTVTNYVTFSGKAFSKPQDALSAEHDDAAAGINEVIRGASSKDYLLPHAYLRELVLALVPMPKIERYGIHPESVETCRAKVEATIDILTKYSTSLSDYLKIMEGDDQ